MKCGMLNILCSQCLQNVKEAGLPGADAGIRNIVQGDG